MILATSTNLFYERKGASPIPMEQSMRACAAAGFLQLDFGFAELAFSSQAFREQDWRQELESYQQLAAELGVRFVQGHAAICDFCNESPASHSFELLQRSIQGAAMLGIPWLVAHPSTHLVAGQAQPDTHAQNVAFFRELSDYAHGYGVGIAIENMWGYAAPEVPRYAIAAQEVCQLVDDIGRDNIGVCWDVEHASVEQLPQGDSIRLLGNRIKATHISDETGPNNIHILPYTGFVKWEEVLHAFADIGYTGAFSLEVQHYLPQMPLPLCAEAMRLAYSVGNYLVQNAMDA